MSTLQALLKLRALIITHSENSKASFDKAFEMGDNLNAAQFLGERKACVRIREVINQMIDEELKA
jgi:hypothetical protein